MEKKPNVIKEKSYQFAVEVTRLYKTLQVQNEYVLSKQLVRAGTSIGANVEEATTAKSGKDFYTKMAISIGLPPPTFTETSDRIKREVSVHKLLAKTGYRFIYPNPMEFKL